MRRIVVIVVVLLLGVALCVAARMILASRISAQAQRISEMRLQVEKAERRMPGIEAVRAKVANDQLLVSQRLSSITSQTLGRGKDKVAEMSAILSDTELNRLALVYLGSDWSIQRSAFLGNVDHMRRIITMQRDERIKMESRVEKKIKELELKKKRLARSMDKPNLRRGMPHGDPGWFLETKDVDDQLFDLRHTAAYRKMINDDLAAEKVVEAKAMTEKAIFEMAMTCQANTVGALSNVMAGQIGALKLEQANALKHIASLQDNIEWLGNLQKLQSWLNFWPLNTMWPASKTEH